MDSGLCIGTARVRAITNAGRAASSRVACRLRPSGSSDVQNIDADGGVFTFPYAPLINGADTNFSNPFVLTYPQNG